MRRSETGEDERLKSKDRDEWMQTEECGVQTGKGDRVHSPELSYFAFHLLLFPLRNSD